MASRRSGSSGRPRSSAGSVQLRNLSTIHESSAERGVVEREPERLRPRRGDVAVAALGLAPRGQRVEVDALVAGQRRRIRRDGFQPLADVQRLHQRRVAPRQAARDRAPEVVAVDQEALVVQVPGHELREELRGGVVGARAIEPGIREAVAGARRDDDVERVRQRRDDVAVLDEARRPAVDQQQRPCVGPPATRPHHMQPDAVHGHAVLGQRVERALLRAPVEAVAPALEQSVEGIEPPAVLAPGHEQLRRPAGVPQPPGEVVERRVGHGDRKRLHGGHFLAHLTNQNRK